jgi:putative hydrolase of the HAD superfamily
MRKPDRESFQHILLENGLNGEETMFVDDAKVNVEGAERAGLRGLFLPPGITLMDFQW